MYVWYHCLYMYAIFYFRYSITSQNINKTLQHRLISISKPPYWVTTKLALGRSRVMCKVDRRGAPRFGLRYGGTSPTEREIIRCLKWYTVRSLVTWEGFSGISLELVPLKPVLFNVFLVINPPPPQTLIALEKSKTRFRDSYQWYIEKKHGLLRSSKRLRVWPGPNKGRGTGAGRSGQRCFFRFDKTTQLTQVFQLLTRKKSRSIDALNFNWNYKGQLIIWTFVY